MRRLLLGGLVVTLMATSVSFGAIIDFKNAPNGVWSTGIAPSNVVLIPSAGGTLNAQTDTHYTLIKLPTGCTGVSCQETNTPGDLFGPAAYVVLGGNGTYPLNGVAWVRPNDANSSWIGPRADQRNPNGGGSTYDNTGVFSSDTDFYVYRMVFNLSVLGIDPTTASISLGWLADNYGVGFAPPNPSDSIRLCSIGSAGDTTPCAAGTVTGSGNTGQGTSALSTVNITSGFTSGFMALDFIVYNSVFPGLNPSGLNVSILSATGSTEGTPNGVPEPASFMLLAAGLIGIGIYSRRKA